jgi:hypothetical protein
MSFTPCPRCGSPVLFVTSFGREVLLELQSDEDEPDGAHWVAHSDDRCEFSCLIAANFESG